MIRNLLRSKALWAFILPLVMAGSAWAGGAGCHGKDGVVTAGKGSHCHLAKGITKVATLTDDGAVVKLTGENEKAIAHIKKHLAAHEEGRTCPDCPLAADGVTTEVEITEDGGKLTVHGATPETIEAVQKWASKPAGQCCAHKSEKA